MVRESSARLGWKLYAKSMKGLPRCVRSPISLARFPVNGPLVEPSAKQVCTSGYVSTFHQLNEIGRRVDLFCTYRTSRPQEGNSCKLHETTDNGHFH